MGFLLGGRFGFFFCWGDFPWKGGGVFLRNWESMGFWLALPTSLGALLVLPPGW